MWTSNTIFIESKNHLHIFASFFLHTELVLILRSFLVAVGSEYTYKLTVLLLDL